MVRFPCQTTLSRCHCVAEGISGKRLNESKGFVEWYLQL